MMDGDNLDFECELNSPPLVLTPRILKRMPVLPIEEAVAVPNIDQQLPDSDPDYANVIYKSIESNTPVVVVFRSIYNPEKPEENLSDIGVIGRVLKYIERDEEDELNIIFFHADERVVIKNIFHDSKGRLLASCELYPIEFDLDPYKATEILKAINPVYDRLLRYGGKTEVPDLSVIIKNFPTLTAFMFAFFSAPVDLEEKDYLMHKQKISDIMESFLLSLIIEEHKMNFRVDLQSKVQNNLDKNNRENFLRQEMEVIRDELGDTESDDIEDFRKRAKSMKWNEGAAEHFEKELRKLQRYPNNSPDYSIQATYLDTLLSLPWDNYADSDFEFERILEVLDRDHFGLEKVKERILEQMAVAKLRADNRAPILCLVGPPGVGKTSLGRSIAEAMGREYTRVSFGGMHDEAEIRGHRRTYIGALPGRLMAALTKIKFSNPVMVLDEIDKIGHDFKGDPSTALLEVLDPEQNSHFHDNYIDIDYDLSNVLFIATANSLDTISAPLLDRMEIISIPGYITAEKVEIASRHLVPKQLKANGFEKEEISFENDALVYLTDRYTRESGVRKLEKTIAKVLRKLAVLKVRGEEYPKLITKYILKNMLGKEEYSPEEYENNDSVGVVTGLAWTSVGGEILFIESSVTDGKGKLTLTGNLGDVMKESATLALQYLKAHANELGIGTDRFDKCDVHIHVPEGAIPKDGPSAGITMATSLASAFTGRKIRQNIAMTGEITLRGKVLPVGGIKEKIIAAKRAGITEIILCKENMKDISEISERYVEGLRFIYVDRIEEVLKKALL